MSENWLEHGHSTDPSRLPPVFSRAPAGPGAATGLGAGAMRRGPLSLYSGPWFVAIVTAVVVFGSAGAAYAIRETLFPSLGAPTTQSVWQNPTPADEPVPASTSTTSTTSTSTSTTSTTVADEVAPVETLAQGEPSHSTITVDDHGGSIGSGHDDGPSPTAPSATASSVTTVDDHGGGSDPDDDNSGSSGGSGSGSGSDSDDDNSGSSGGSDDNSGSGSGSGSGSDGGPGDGSDDTGPDD